MQTTSPQPDHIPRALLVGAAALVLVSLMAVAAVRLSGANIHAPDASAVATRSLRFEDRSDGSIAIIDARSGLEVERIQGEAGFIRGALRALARERRKRELRPEAAFDLLADLLQQGGLGRCTPVWAGPTDNRVINKPDNQADPDGVDHNGTRLFTDLLGLLGDA